MAAKNRKEIDDNELVGAVTDHLDSIRQQMPKIITGIVALIVVVFGIRYYLSSRDAAKEAKSKNVVLFASEQSAAGSVSTLDEQIEDFPDDISSKWAYLMKADSQLAQGLNRIFRDKTTGMESVKNAITNFEKAADKAGEDKKLKQRALYGWARGLESIGKFDEAAAKYQEIVSNFEDSAFAKLSKIGVERVNSPENREFFVAFEKRENDVFTRPVTNTDSAPATNSGLPSRPDFTYPGEEPVVGTEPTPAVSSGNEPPTKSTEEKKMTNDPSKSGAAKSGAAKSGAAKSGAAKAENEKSPAEQPPAPPTNAKEAKKSEPKKGESEKSEPPVPPTNDSDKETAPKADDSSSEKTKSDPVVDPAAKDPAAKDPAAKDPAGEKNVEKADAKESEAKNPPK